MECHRVCEGSLWPWWLCQWHCRDQVWETHSYQGLFYSFSWYSLRIFSFFFVILYRFGYPSIYSTALFFHTQELMHIDVWFCRREWSTHYAWRTMAVCALWMEMVESLRSGVQMAPISPSRHALSALTEQITCGDRFPRSYITGRETNDPQRNEARQNDMKFNTQCRIENYAKFQTKTFFFWIQHSWFQLPENILGIRVEQYKNKLSVIIWKYLCMYFSWTVTHTVHCFSAPQEGENYHQNNKSLAELQARKNAIDMVSAICRVATDVLRRAQYAAEGMYPTLVLCSSF